MGMPGNMNNLMKQAQKMQRQMEENQKALEEKEFTATAGGGAVEVTISGKREVTKVKLQEEVVDPDDIEMLEDLIVAATNEALRKVEEESTAVMSKLTYLCRAVSTLADIFLVFRTLLNCLKCIIYEDCYSSEKVRIISGNPRQFNYRDESANCAYLHS